MKKQYFKVGDKVTCCMYGKGEVVYLNYNIKNGYVMQVRFPSPVGIRDYTADGRLNIQGRRILYHGHLDIAEPELKEILTFEKGEIVWCVDKQNKWHCVKFEEFHPDLPQNVLASHPQENSIYCVKEYYGIKKYEDRPF